MASVVALHAHPDDESSKGAATLARLSDDGFRCVLVCATGGEAGDILNPAMDRPDVRERLAWFRSVELDTAAAILGYDEIVRLGYRDSGMPGSADNRHVRAFANASHDEALARLVAIVRRERPRVVFGYDSHERYPHPDHLMIHALSLDLPAAAADESWRPEAGPPWQIPLVVAPTFTARRAGALREAMERIGLDPPPRYRALADRRCDDDPALLVRVDVRGYVGRARRALRAHATQIDPGGPWFAVPTDLVESAYPYEDFSVLSAREGVFETTTLFEPWGPD